MAYKDGTKSGGKKKGEAATAPDIILAAFLVFPCRGGCADNF